MSSKKSDLKDEFRDRLFESARSAFATSFFVSDDVEAKIHEAIDVLLDDPRNQEVLQVGAQFVDAVANATPQAWAEAEKILDEGDEEPDDEGPAGEPS